MSSLTNAVDLAGVVTTEVSSAQVIDSASAVFLHMVLKLSDGSVAESSKAQGKPAKFQMGDGSLSAAIEAELLGLKVGDRKQFTVAAEDGFGAREPGLIQHLQRHDFPAEIELVAGTIVAFSHPSGGEMPGVIRNVAGDSITIDFNHPLAGETLSFEVEILAILSAEVVH